MSPNRFFQVHFFNFSSEERMPGRALRICAPEPSKWQRAQSWGPWFRDHWSNSWWSQGTGGTAGNQVKGGFDKTKTVPVDQTTKVWSLTFSQLNLCQVARLRELLKKNGPRGPTPLAYRIHQLTGRLLQVLKQILDRCDPGCIWYSISFYIYFSFWTGHLS